MEMPRGTQNMVSFTKQLLIGETGEKHWSIWANSRGSWTWRWTLETDWGRLSGARAACCALLGAQALAPTGACAPSTGRTKKERSGSRNYEGSSSPGASRLTCSATHTRSTKTGEAQSYSVLVLKHKDSPGKTRIQVVCSCGENDSCACSCRLRRLQQNSIHLLGPCVSGQQNQEGQPHQSLPFPPLTYGTGAVGLSQCHIFWKVTTVSFSLCSFSSFQKLVLYTRHNKPFQVKTSSVLVRTAQGSLS